MVKKQKKEVEKSNEVKPILIKKYSLGISMIMILILLCIALSFFGFIKDLFYRTIGTFQTDLMLNPILGTFTILTMIMFLFFLLNYNQKKENKLDKWFIIYLVVTFFLIISGLIFIDMTIGVQNINGWKLQDSKGSEVGRINCYSNNMNDQLILANDSVSCSYKTNLILNYSYTRTDLILKNGSKIIGEGKYIYDENYTGSFYAYPDTKYVIFYLSGLNLEKNYLYETYSVGYFHKFYTLEGYDENKKTFLTYVLGLLGLIFLTTPFAINEIKKLWRGE